VKVRKALFGFKFQENKRFGVELGSVLASFPALPSPFLLKLRRSIPRRGNFDSKIELAGLKVGKGRLPVKVIIL